MPFLCLFVIFYERELHFTIYWTCFADHACLKKRIILKLLGSNLQKVRFLAPKQEINPNNIREFSDFLEFSTFLKEN